MTSVSTLGQILDQVERLRVTQSSLSTMQIQLTTGKKSQTFMGLDTDVVISQRARASVKRNDTYTNNINIAERRLKLMQEGLSEIKKHAGNVLSGLQIQTQQGEYEMGAISDLAKKSLDFIMNIINEKDGDRYLFAGAEALDMPLDDTGTLNTYMRTQLNQWVTYGIDTDALVSSYRDRSQLNDTITGYSATLTSGTAKSVTIRVEENTEIDFTILGNHQGLRDIVAALGMLENIDGVLDEVTLEDGDNPLTTVTAPGLTREEQNENFFQLFNDLAQMLNGALDLIESEEYKLSQIQGQVTDIRDNYKVENHLLQETIADVEDVDVNEVAVKLNALQVQLEASYRVTAAVQSLSIVNFLPIV